MNDAPDAPGYWGPSDPQHQQNQHDQQHPHHRPYRPGQPLQQPHPQQAHQPQPDANGMQHTQQFPPYPAGPAAAGDQGHRTGHSQQPPVYWGGDAEETQVMPPVPTTGPGPEPTPRRSPGRTAQPGPGPAEEQSGREAGRLSGPLFRDEQPETAVPGAAETVVLRAVTENAGPAQAPVGRPYPQAPGLPGAPAYPGPPPSHPAAGQPHLVPSSHPGQETPVAEPEPQPRKQRGGRNLQAAIGVGVGLGAVIIASLFVVKALFLVVVMAAVVVGVWELSSRLTERKEINAPLIPLVAGSIAMISTGYWAGVQWAAASLALTGLAVMVWRMAQPPENYLRDITAGIFTAFYVPFLATFVAMMLAADDGPQRIVLFLIVTVCSDTGAYAVGYKFGKNKLAPTISPGKTREGLAGGIGLSMLAGALLMELIIDDGSWWQGLILGGCAAVTATLGDLGESMIKRDLGIKDMGTLLPGHGGIMDRLDSLLPTAPVVWLLLAAFVGS